MNKQTIKEILICIIISYLITSYIGNDFNPFNLTSDERLIQVFMTAVAMFIRQMLKNY